MSYEKGSLSIHSENIMPIIKKWLYSDTDIFLRELVSNATDAIKKLQKLAQIGEAEVNDDEIFEINVTVDRDNGTIMVSDNGIGMTAEEIKKYINQIAFSGANDFVEKYKDKMDKGSEIIGHFGLGFYSAFMVSDKVQIDTLSYREGAAAAKWISDGSESYEIDECDRENRGTTVTLFINEENKDFLDEYKVKATLRKYCGFMPIEIYVNVIDSKKPEKTEDDGEEGKEPPVNITKPLWMKEPKDCQDDEYKEFYHKTFTDFNDPLFWIHLNMDYPLRLKGILFFPKLNHEFESVEGQVKLYNNQVYIADNIKEVIPEFLLLLKGVIDCPDLPLNVSRSFLQNDGYVTKMSGYITKKVADKLTSIFKEDREQYNKYWSDIHPFVKYGCIKEKTFYDKINDCVVYKAINGEFLTTSEYLERNEEKIGKKIYYVTDLQQQSQYIKLFKEQDIDAVELVTRIDAPFISYLENYDKDVQFLRIDAELGEVFKGAEKDSGLEEKLGELFKKALGSEELKVSVEALKSEKVSAVILLSEQSRRMQEMSKQMGYFGTEFMQTDETLVLNQNNPLFIKLLELENEGGNEEKVNLLCKYVYDLAMISHKPLKTEEMTDFIERGNTIMTMLAEN